eukprot:scaffold25029_cov75-Phaeocystis_antarctica.AAC.3
MSLHARLCYRGHNVTACAPPAMVAMFLAVFSRAGLQTMPALPVARFAVHLRTNCERHTALGLDGGIVAHLLLDCGREGQVVAHHETGEGSGLQSHLLSHVVLPVRARAGTVYNGADARAASEAAGRGGCRCAHG